MGLFDRLRGDDDGRVAFVGIDGVPYSLLADHESEFPNFAALAEEGSAGAIDSIVPPESSACWPALTTGVNPGETGVYGFQDRETGTYETYVPMGGEVQATRLWDRVSDAGREASVLNVPVSFPPGRTVRRMVSGFLSPALEDAAAPESFRDYLLDADYRLDVDPKLGHADDKSEFMTEAREVLDRRQEEFLDVIGRDDWDLFFGVFMTTDRVNHFLFEDYERDGELRERFFEFYRTVDEYVGEIRERLPDDATLVVASDHGFTTLDHEVYCNEWLERNGWLSYDADDHEALADISPDAQAYSFIPGRFYLNLEGREPDGAVAQSEYERRRAELKADLEAWTGPDGRPVADRVVEREAAFRGDHDDIAPDLVVVPNDGFDLKSGFGGDHDEVFGDGPRNGMHSFHDACLYVDDPDATIRDADLYDVAPTILDLLEIDHSRAEFDGASLVRG